MNDRRAWDTLEEERYEEDYGRAPAVDGCMEKRMGFIAKDTGGGDFKTVPPGTHLARCYRLIDLGTQEVEWSGEKKLQLKIQLGWELFGEDDDGQPLLTDDGMPLVISKRYTRSLSKKANLKTDLESWRGRSFTDDELRGFDISNLLDKWCLLGVIHNTKGDKTYANVASISGVPKAMKSSLPAAVHELQAFDVTDPDMELFEKFHEKLKETIQSCLEWRSKGNLGGSDPNKDLAMAGAYDDDDSDIPF